MKCFCAVFLGILTAIGGFVDIGALVANSQTGTRFGMNLAWAVVLGVIGPGALLQRMGRRRLGGWIERPTA